MIIITNDVSQKDKEILYNNIYMRNLKYETYEVIHETETDSQVQRTSGYQWGWGGGRGSIGVGD